MNKWLKHSDLIVHLYFNPIKWVWVPIFRYDYEDETIHDNFFYCIFSFLFLQIEIVIQGGE